jgi:hypothetical protein
LTAQASAQTPAPPTLAQSELAHVARLIGAIWRPLPENANQASLTAACAGAIEEMNAVNAQLPEDVTPEATRAVRAERGLVIVNAAAPGEAYLFPNPELAGVASGPARFVVIDSAQGRVDLTDSAGRIFRLQLGIAGGKAMMRILRGEAPPLAYVGCASTG